MQLLHIKQDVAKHKWSQHISKQNRLNWKSIVYNVHVEPVWAFICGSIKQSTARQPQVTKELLVKKIELISNVSGPDSANDSSRNPCYKPNVRHSGPFDTLCNCVTVKSTLHSTIKSTWSIVEVMLNAALKILIFISKYAFLFLLMFVILVVWRLLMREVLLEWVNTFSESKCLQVFLFIFLLVSIILLMMRKVLLECGSTT